MSLGPTGRSPSDEDPVDRSEEAVSIWNESVRLVWIPRVDDGSSSTLLQSGKTDGEDGKTACEFHPEPSWPCQYLPPLRSWVVNGHPESQL